MMDERKGPATEATRDGQHDVDRVRKLEQELAAAEATIEALMAGEVDAVIRSREGDAVLLHEAQEALRNSERRWRAIFETALDAIFVVDDDARFREANDAACDLLGVPHKQLLQYEIDDLTSADYDFEASWSSFLASKKAHGEIPVHRPDGTVRHTEYSGVANFLPGRHLFIVRDVTERREMERVRELAQEQLRASEVRYRTLFETMVQGVVYQDNKGRIITANPAAERMLGLAQEQMAGRTALDPRWRLLRRDGKPFPAEETPAEIALRTGREVRNVVIGVYNPAREEHRWLNVHAVPIFHPGHTEPYQVHTTLEDVTERLRAEDRLRFQAQLLDNVREAVVAANLDGEVIYWGKGAEALYGYSAEEMMGEPTSKTFADPDSSQWREEALATGSWRGECRQRRQDGETFWASVSISLVRGGASQDEASEGEGAQGEVSRSGDTTGPEGEPAGFIGIARDVTQRKRHQREMQAVAAVGDALRTALRPQEILSVVLDELGSLLQAQNVAAIMVDDEQGNVVVERMQGTWEDVSGLRVQLDEGIGPEVIRSGEPFVTEDLGADPRLLLPHILDEKSAAVCVPLIARDDAIGALWASRPAPFTATEVHLMTAAAEIAAGALQRADLYERLEAQALQLQQIVDNVGHGLALLDGERRVLLANPAGATRLALLSGSSGEPSPESVVGRRVTHLDDLALESFLEPPPEDEPAHLLETAGRLFEVALHPLAEGADRGWVLILRDVTEEQRMQERIQQQDRLASLGQLAAGIAHDFNNVMSAIFLYTQVLQGRPGLEGKDKERLDLIYRQAQHATNLIRQILDFSRRSVMERSALDLVPFVKEMFKLWRRTLPETITLRMHHDAARYVVDADPTRLQQAMMNLAINARDAMPDGGELSVRLSSLDLQSGGDRPLPEMEPGVWLQLEVTDTGEGIGEEALSHIFDPFFTTKPVGKGTGLGLSQVYGIIRQHGGHIRVKSQLGEGTTFTIYLPLMQKEAETVEETIPEMPPAPDGRWTVLVVEDEEAARLALVESLDALGYEVLGAGDGEEALAICRDPGQEVDLVVSDLVMPKMGGTALYHALREEFPAIQMVLMSGYPLDGASRELLEQKAVVWMQKPFSISDLEARVSEALRRGV